MAVTLTNTFGVTVTFATTAPVFRLRGIRINPGERNTIDTSSLNVTAFDSGVSAFGTSIPGGIIRGGTIEFDVIWGFDEAAVAQKLPPIHNAVEVIEVTFTGSGTIDGRFTVSGFITNYTIDGGDDTEYTGTVTCSTTGAPTWRDAS